VKLFLDLYDKFVLFSSSIPSGIYDWGLQYTLVISWCSEVW